jgi:hypothetical protein
MQGHRVRHQGQGFTGMPHIPAFGMVPFNPLFSGMQQFALHYSSSLAQMGKEWSGFVIKRLEEDASLSQRLAVCRTPEEAMTVYGTFLQKMTTDYQKEMSVITQLGFQAYGEGLSAMRGSIELNASEPATH